MHVWRGFYFCVFISDDGFFLLSHFWLSNYMIFILSTNREFLSYFIDISTQTHIIGTHQWGEQEEISRIAKNEPGKEFHRWTYILPILANGCHHYNKIDCLSSISLKGWWLICLKSKYPKWIFVHQNFLWEFIKKVQMFFYYSKFWDFFKKFKRNLILLQKFSDKNLLQNDRSFTNNFLFYLQSKNRYNDLFTTYSYILS